MRCPGCPAGESAGPRGARPLAATSATSLRPAQPPCQALWCSSPTRFPHTHPPNRPFSLPSPPRPVHRLTPPSAFHGDNPDFRETDSLHLTPFLPGTAAGVYAEESEERQWSSEQRASLDDDTRASGRWSATWIIGVGEFSRLPNITYVYVYNFAENH